MASRRLQLNVRETLQNYGSADPKQRTSKPPSGAAYRTLDGVHGVLLLDEVCGTVDTLPGTAHGTWQLHTSLHTRTLR